MNTPTPRTCGELSCDECDARTAAITTERDQLRAELQKVYALVTPVGFDLPGGIFETAQAVSELRAERDQLRGALALGQQNCDDAYDDLRTERAAAIARAERAEAALADAKEECKNVRLKWHAVMGTCSAKEDAIIELDEELARLRAERAEAEIIRLRTENSDLKATDTRPLLTGKLTHAGLCRIDGELVDGVFIAVYREQIKACPRLPMYQEIELRIVAYK